MNCTPGCLAFFVGPREPDDSIESALCDAARGRVVRLVSHVAADVGMVWLFERPISVSFWYGPAFITAEIESAGEDLLRPIDPDGGQDEVLRFADSPVEHEVAPA